MAARPRLLRRPQDLISYAVRRLALTRAFSRSPFARTELELVPRPGDDALGDHVDTRLVLTMLDWSVFEDVLFVAFRVEPRAGSAAPTCGMVLFSSCAVEFPLERRGVTRIAVPVPASHLGAQVELGFVLADGSTVVDPNPGPRILIGDDTTALLERFRAELSARPPGRILEIGSRARSGVDYRYVVPDGWEYTGMDLKPGPNVDVVADAHELATAVGDRRFDAVLSVSVFEHLLMPWKVVLEINRVLEPGGLVFVSTHQAYPLHDAPWDYWRFSDRAWLGLLNPDTGFELLGTAVGQPASVVPRATHAGIWNLGSRPAFLLSSALGRKTGDSLLEWSVDVRRLVDTEYPG